MNVERVVRYLLNQGVINRYIAVIVLKRKKEETQEGLMTDMTEVEIEVEIDLAPVIGKCLMLYVINVVRIAKFLLDLLEINQFTVVSVLRRKRQDEEVLGGIVEEAELVVMPN
jgi:hypothetical protein